MTIATLAALLLFSGVVLADRGSALAWWWRNARERALADTVWTRYGGRWLGLHTRADEAISGLRNAVGLYARMPKVRGGWPTWPLNEVLAPVVELPLNYLLRLIAQGAPKLGAVLATIDTEPVPHANARGAMPDALDQALRSQADRYSHSHYALDVERAREAFVALSLMDTAGWPAVQALWGNIELHFGLYHNFYYRIDLIRCAVAHHILGHVAAGSCEPVEQLDTPTLAWLRQVPGARTGFLAPNKPLLTTPWRSQAPYALAAAALLALGLLGLHADFHGRLLPNLQKAIGPGDPAVSGRAIGALVQIGRTGDDALIGRALDFIVIGPTGADPEGEYELQPLLCKIFKVRGPSFIEAVIERYRARNDPSERLKLLRLLRDLGHNAGDATPFLTGLLQGGIERSFPEESRLDAREYTLRVLRAIGPGAAGAVPALEQMVVNSRDEFDQRDAVDTLDAIGCAALPALRNLQKDSGKAALNAKLQKSIADAIESIRARVGGAARETTGGTLARMPSHDP
jgi:hypothetical protein